MKKIVATILVIVALGIIAIVAFPKQVASLFSPHKTAPATEQMTDAELQSMFDSAMQRAIDKGDLVKREAVEEVQDSLAAARKELAARPKIASDPELVKKVGALASKIDKIQKPAPIIISQSSAQLPEQLAPQAAPVMKPQTTASGLVSGTIGGGPPPPPPNATTTTPQAYQTQVASPLQAPVSTDGLTTGLDKLTKAGPPVAFVRNGRTYFSKELVGRNKYGDPSIPVDGKYRLIGVSSGPWSIISSTPVLSDEGSYLVFNAVVKGSCQIGWNNPDDPAFDSAHNCVWAPVGEFFSGRLGTFCRDPDYQIRPVLVP